MLRASNVRSRCALLFVCARIHPGRATACCICVGDPRSATPSGSPPMRPCGEARQSKRCRGSVVPDGRAPRASATLARIPPLKRPCFGASGYPVTLPRWWEFRLARTGGGRDPARLQQMASGAGSDVTHAEWDAGPATPPRPADGWELAVWAPSGVEDVTQRPPRYPPADGWELAVWAPSGVEDVTQRPPRYPPADGWAHGPGTVSVSAGPAPLVGGRRSRAGRPSYGDVSGRVRDQAPEGAGGEHRRADGDGEQPCSKAGGRPKDARRRGIRRKTHPWDVALRVGSDPCSTWRSRSRTTGRDARRPGGLPPMYPPRRTSCTSCRIREAATRWPACPWRRRREPRLRPRQPRSSAGDTARKAGARFRSSDRCDRPTRKWIGGHRFVSAIAQRARTRAAGGGANLANRPAG